MTPTEVDDRDEYAAKSAGAVIIDSTRTLNTLAVCPTYKVTGVPVQQTQICDNWFIRRLTS